MERDLLLGLPVGVGEDRDVLPLFILARVSGIGYCYELGFVVEEGRSPEKYIKHCAAYRPVCTIA